MSDLVERLRAEARERDDKYYAGSALLDEAAADLARLRAEAAAARSAGWREGLDAAADRMLLHAAYLRAKAPDVVSTERMRGIAEAAATLIDDLSAAIRAIPDPKEPTDA